MSVLFYGSLLFGLAFVLHVVWWRIRLPKRQIKVLLIILFGFLCVGSFILHQYALKISILGLRPPSDISEYSQLATYFISLILAYMITYSAIEADSPSLLIVMKISDARKSGLTKEMLGVDMDDSVLVEPRIKDLLTDKMAEMREGKYHLTTKGLMMALLFKFYRDLMRADKGG